MHTSAPHGAHGVSGTAKEVTTQSEQQEGASSGAEGLSTSDTHSGVAAQAVRHHPVAHTCYARSQVLQTLQQSSINAGACRAGSAGACKIAV